MDLPLAIVTIGVVASALATARYYALDARRANRRAARYHAIACIAIDAEERAIAHADECQMLLNMAIDRATDHITDGGAA